MGQTVTSVTRFKGHFYITIRNDMAGYVTSGTDGLHYDKPKKWTFDDGADLGNYNTQQHWVTHVEETERVGFELSIKHSGKSSWYLSDPIRFNKSIKVTLEHKSWISHDENPDYKKVSCNEREDDYATVAFWYQTGTPTFAARHASFPQALVT